jgi:hypothetical protein
MESLIPVEKQNNFVIFKKTAQSKQSPNGRKFAPSGHPAVPLLG